MPQLRLERGAPVATREETPRGPRAGKGASETSYGKLKPGPGKSREHVARNQRSRIQSAMAELLGEQPYEAITVRMLARRARVSTRTFYQCYSGREECFLKLHEQTVRRLLSAVTLSRLGVDSAERIRQAVAALWGELASDPAAARLLLIDVHAAGLEAQAQARRARRSLELRMGDCIDDSLGEHAGQILSEGIASAVFGVARARLLTGRSLGSSEQLGEWAVSCSDPSLVELDEMSPYVDWELNPMRLRALHRASGATEMFDEGDATLLIAAVTRLIAMDDPNALNLRNVLATAGLPPRAFASNFESLEECVAMALDLRVRKAMDSAARMSRDRPTVARRIACAVAAFCQAFERDPVLTSFCFGRVGVNDVHRLIHFESIKESITGVLGHMVGPPTQTTDQLFSEASVAACWGLLEKESTARGSALPLRLAPRLAYFILAPVVGASEAVDAIRIEHGLRNTTREECSVNHG